MNDDTHQLFLLILSLSRGKPSSTIILTDPLGGGGLGQFCRPSGDIAEIRRLALVRHPGGGIIWKHPAILRYGPVWRLLAPQCITTCRSWRGKGRLRSICGGILVAKMKKKGQFNLGAVPTPMFPIGKRMSPAERSTMMQHCPRRPSSGMSICPDYNAQSGFARCVQCWFAHGSIRGGG